jgi:RNA polymerase sigma-70 factor (ECF subfamily)
MEHSLAATGVPDIAGEFDWPADSQLVQQAKEDIVAFAELYLRYHGRVFSYLRLRSSSDDEAADLTHQVFLKALDGLPRYQERGVPFIAWLLRIARNTAVDAVRKRHTNDCDLIPEVHCDEEANPEVAVLERERLERLRTVIATLAQDKRDLLALRFAGGLSAREIGLVVGKSEEATKKQLSRTLNFLKEQCHEDLA